MAKSSEKSTPGQRCAVCERDFSLALWKHTCDECRMTVCDDCAPRKTKDIDAEGKTTKRRVCKTCITTGRHRVLAAGQNSATGGAPGSCAPRLDPNSEAERERRARLIEERKKAQQSRGLPQHADGEASTRAAVVGKKPALAPPPLTLSVAPPSTAPAPAPPLTNPGNPERVVNPALEAAMRRQQQQQAHRGASASPSGTSISPEKTQLIHAIETLLAKHREDPPLGLRASDETKLRGYLQFLKNKYHVNE